MNHRIFSGDNKLVIESVGTANAVALMAIRQLAQVTVEEAARLVYQAPSLLVDGMQADAAANIAKLLGDLGFEIGVVAGTDSLIDAGTGVFEFSLVLNDLTQVPMAVAEAATFLGCDLTTARRVVCRTPAVLLSNVSEATVAAARKRFEPFDIEIDVSPLHSARYYALVAVDTECMRRALIDMIKGVANEAEVVERNGSLTVSDLSFQQAQALWERLQRIGTKSSICNLDLERYDVSLNSAVDTEPMADLLTDLGIPGRVVPRVLQNLPVVIQQNVRHETMLVLLERIGKAGGKAMGLPYSFQRFSLTFASVKDPAAAAKVLIALGDVSETAAAIAVSDADGTPVGPFTRTTALWLRDSLRKIGAESRIDLA